VKKVFLFKMVYSFSMQMVSSG